jgi:hypothetical protein
LEKIKMKNEEMKNILERFREKYFDIDSIFEINLDSEKKKRFFYVYDSYKILEFDDLIDLFDDLYEGVLINILDTYTRFTQSKDYIKVLKIFSNFINNEI